MKKVFVIIITLTLLSRTKAQGISTKPVFFDYNYIKLELYIYNSDGYLYDGIYDRRNPRPSKRRNPRPSKHEIKMMSIYNQYKIGNCCPKDMIELDSFYERIYQNDTSNYLNEIKEYFTVDKKPINKQHDISNFLTVSGQTFVDNFLLDVNAQYETYFDWRRGLHFRYAASDNVVYDPTDVLCERVVETPYFVPIGYLELYIIEDNKLMHIDFELYDYKKMGFSRPVYNPETGEFPHLKLFMEIQFQEGEFVVTDESYPNLIPKREK